MSVGKSGIGKTTRLKDLDPTTTLFPDIEAGDLAVADWPGAATRPA
ncbi:UNVERIFIED_CONTAM: AAA family ATPase, partial [Salmonella enterica subsp. enterica serovar Weltevreden]